MLNKISQLFQRLVEVSSSDPDDKYRRRNINIIILGIALLLIVQFFISLYLIYLGRPDDLLTIGIAMLISMAGIYWLNRVREGNLSAYILLGMIMLMISVADTPEQLTMGRSLFVFMIPIVMASLILQPYFSFIFALLSSIIVGVLSTRMNVIPNYPAILGYFMVALISWMSAQGLQTALKDLRFINANLDQIVIEQTNELADALSRERIEASRNQAILNSIADGVIVFDNNDVSILANPALSRLTDIPVQDVKEMSLLEFVHAKNIPPASERSILALIQNSGQPEEINPHIEWGNKFLSVNVAHVRDAATSEKVGSVAVFRDITRETQIEKMKDNFVAVVSHELRTPLNAIMGHAEILKEKVHGALNEKQISVTERIMVNVTRLLNMVGDLLSEAQMRAGTLTVTSEVIKPASLLEDLRSTMDKPITDKGLEFTTRVGKDMPAEITGDPQRLQQILTNLVNNALKFTKQGFIAVAIDRAGTNTWKIEVTDSGFGIPENEMESIFEAFRQANNLEFTTRQYRGIGLGLSIVKQLVELMNGEVQVKSEKDKGSTFTVVLPLITNP